MRRPRRVLLAGLGVCVVYVLTAILIGRGHLAARRPLLDGFAPPPPYRWVQPPPALAATNKKPVGGRFTLDLDPQTGTSANVFTTKDTQASIALGQGAIRPLSGDTSVGITITPLATTGFGSPPPAWTIAGNVYQITAAYEPSGTPVRTLHEAAQIVLTYPGVQGVHYSHVVLASQDRKTWTAITGIDSSFQELIQVYASTLGYFAVGRSASGSIQHRSLWSRIGSVALIVGGVVVLALLFVVGEVRYRRRHRARQAAPRRPRPPKRRPPQGRPRMDPWE